MGTKSAEGVVKQKAAARCWHSQMEDTQPDPGWRRSFILCLSLSLSLSLSMCVCIYIYVYAHVLPLSEPLCGILADIGARIAFRLSL